MDDTLPTNPKAQSYKPATGEELPFETPGRYAEEESEIGRGGIGRVVVRKDVLLGREVAVKELLPEFQPSRGTAARDIADRFLTEARVTARLEHPGIVPVYELGRRADGSLYYAMKRVRGRTLEQALDDCASVADRLTLMQHVLDVVQTLAYAHSHGVIHRDLKPANVMVGEFGETQVLDWGLARVRGVNDVGPTGERQAVPSRADESLSTTQAGQLLGTPAYMSPEQAAGNNDVVDERSDVWCLGAILYETLTGRQLFEADTVAAMLEAVKVAPVRKVRQVEAEVPKALADVADRALQRDPEKRFTSAVEMAEAFEYALRKPTVAGRPAGVVLAFAGAIAALVLAIVGIFNAQADAETARSFAEDTHASAARNESALIARLAREELEKRDYARADALARQALASTGSGEGDPLARGVLALLEGAARPVLRWETGTPGCAGVAAERGLVACPTFGAVELRSLETGELVKSLSTGPTGWQHAAAFMPDGTLLSAGDDRLVHVWDAAGNELAKWPGHPAPITALALRGGTVATGALDGEVRSWEGPTGTSRVLAKHAGPVRALAFTRNDELATSGPDGFRVWALEAKGASAPKITLDMPASAMARGPKGLFFSVEREAFALTGDDAVPLAGSALDEVTAVATSDVASLIVGDGRGHVRAFDARRSLLWRLSGVDRGVRALAVEAGDSSGRVLVVASRGRSLQAFELPEDPRLWLDEPAVAWGWEEGAASARAAILLGDRKGKV
ncbi:MAG: protein kinase, partial [Myxococcaceae bacterium]|nr:protein kinase [Myxococcaceae bacterium]